MSSPKTIFYMYGRFQPFTLGHYSLYEQMIETASQSNCSDVYLCVSYAKTQPTSLSKTNYEILLKIISNPDVLYRRKHIEPVKGILSIKGNIANSPLTTQQRMKIICYILGIKDDPELEESNQAYSKSEVILKDRGVKVHIINTEKIKAYQGGFFNVNKQLIKDHSDVKKENIIMFTGSDRKDKTAIQMISVERTETNTSVSHDVTKLSGSKIRALCLLNINNNQNIYDMYGDKLTPEEVNMLIITPVRDKILEKGMSTFSSAPGGGGAASAYGGRGRGGAAFGSKKKKKKKNTMKRKKKQNASQKKKRGSKQKKNTLFDEIDD
jgi:hypothetical protein